MGVVDRKADINDEHVRSGYVNAPFHLAKDYLAQEKYKIITSTALAELRILKGMPHPVCIEGTRTKTEVVMIPQKGRFLSDYSLIMEEPLNAVCCHMNGAEFGILPEHVEKYLGSRNVIIPEKQTSIPFNRFGEDPITIFLFKNSAKKYGELLENILGKGETPLKFDDMEKVNAGKMPYTNQLWIAGIIPQTKSCIEGYGRILNCADAVRGICYKKYKFIKS